MSVHPLTGHVWMAWGDELWIVPPDAAFVSRVHPCYGPRDIDIDEEGRVWVLDAAHALHHPNQNVPGIRVFTSFGKHLYSFGGTNEWLKWFAEFIAVDHQRQRVFVAGHSTSYGWHLGIHIYDLHGQHLGPLPRLRCHLIKQLDDMLLISDRLFLADSKQEQVLVLSLSGDVTHRIDVPHYAGPYCHPPGRVVLRPYTLTFDSMEQLLLLDKRNGALRAYGSGDQLLTTCTVNDGWLVDVHANGMLLVALHCKFLQCFAFKPPV